MRRLIPVLAMLMSTPFVVLAANTALRIDHMAVGTAIDNRNLDGAAATFSMGVPRLYCWMHVSGATPPVTLKHVWLLNGQKIAEVTLPINHPEMRTWSSKMPQSGNWTVEATDESGTVLSSTTFTVK